MTKKSSRRLARDRKEPVQETMRYRSIIMDVPMPLWKRVIEAQVAVAEKGLLPAATRPHDWILLLIVNGLAVSEADLKSRDRQLIVTPEEAARKWGLTNR